MTQEILERPVRENEILRGKYATSLRNLYYNKCLRPMLEDFYLVNVDRTWTRLLTCPLPDKLPQGHEESIAMCYYDYFLEDE